MIPHKRTHAPIACVHAWGLSEISWRSKGQEVRWRVGVQRWARACVCACVCLREQGCGRGCGMGVCAGLGGERGSRYVFVSSVEECSAWHSRTHECAIFLIESGWRGHRWRCGGRARTSYSSQTPSDSQAEHRKPQLAPFLAQVLHPGKPAWMEGLKGKHFCRPDPEALPKGKHLCRPAPGTPLQACTPEHCPRANTLAGLQLKHPCKPARWNTS